MEENNVVPRQLSTTIPPADLMQYEKLNFLMQKHPIVKKMELY
jgi:hypothetical protein